MIYDCFTFFNELDLLEIRFSELASVVDRFVLVEATKTFTNKPKPLFYLENRERYRAFNDRVIHVVVDDLPEAPEDHWQNQYHQRNAILRGLHGCAPEDVILISDVDEIPRAVVVSAFDGELALFEQNFYYYRLNCLCTSHKWQIPAILRYRNLTTPQQIRDLWYSPALRENIQIIPHAGWHFSYLGNVDQILRKMESISGQEYNTPTNRNRAHIARSIAAGQDLFGRPRHSWAYVPLDETYPKAIRENLVRWREYIGPVTPVQYGSLLPTMEPPGSREENLSKRALIVVVTHNALERATRPCLESIFRAKVKTPFAVVVVDNGSADGTPEYLQELGTRTPNLSVILNSENRGFASATNQGLALGGADVYVLLNNDTVVDDGWLDGLVGFLEGHPEVGMAGPVSNAVGNEQRLEFEPADEESIRAAGRDWAAHCPSDYFYTEMLGFFCVAIRHEVVSKVGLLDERFGIGYFEDDDYCLRARENGFLLACHEGTFVFHKGSVSFGRCDEREVDSLYRDNMAKFEDKHRRRWVPKPDVAPLIRVIRGYLDDFRPDRASTMDMKVRNRLASLERFDYARERRESVQIVRNQASLIAEQQARISELEFECRIRRTLAGNSARLAGPFKIFGTGAFARKVAQYLGHLSVGLSGYFDNDSARWGVNEEGLPVSAPEYLAGTLVMVCSQHADSICPQLASLGYRPEEIITF